MCLATCINQSWLHYTKTAFYGGKQYSQCSTKTKLSVVTETKPSWRATVSIDSFISGRNLRCMYENFRSYVCKRKESKFFAPVWLRCQFVSVDIDDQIKWSKLFAPVRPISTIYNQLIIWMLLRTSLSPD